ncbi:MAG: hypothetical protein ACP5VS_14595 [Desulfomonilaceae bacterium]
MVFDDKLFENRIPQVPQGRGDSKQPLSEDPCPYTGVGADFGIVAYGLALGPTSGPGN